VRTSWTKLRVVPFGSISLRLSFLRNATQARTGSVPGLFAEQLADQQAAQRSRLPRRVHGPDRSRFAFSAANPPHQRHQIYQVCSLPLVTTQWAR
jgi:hypothetical protein